MYDTSSELYNEFLETYFDKYNDLEITRRKTINSKYGPKKLFLETHKYGDWLENEELTDKEESVDSFDRPPLEGDEEVTEGKRLNILTPKKFLTRVPILAQSRKQFIQIKAGNNLYKLKNEIRQILYVLHQHNKITRKV